MGPEGPSEAWFPEACAQRNSATAFICATGGTDMKTGQVQTLTETFEVHAQQTEAGRSASLSIGSQLGGGALTLALAHSLCLQLLNPSNGLPVCSDHAALIDQPSLETADRLASPFIAQDGAAL